MMNQQQYKKRLIQLIQINKHNVFVDDESRKEFMLSRFGVESTTKLSIDQLKLLLDFCKGVIKDIPCNLATEAQLYKINQLWNLKAKHKGDESLEAFLKRIIKKVSNLTKQDATKVLIALDKLK
jgi:phage gp16-like protein